MQKLRRLLTLVVALAVAFGPAWTMAAPMKSHAASTHSASPIEGQAAPIDMPSSGDCALCTGEQDTMSQCVAPCWIAAALAGPDLIWVTLPDPRYGALVRQVLADVGIGPEPYPPKSILPG